MTVQWGLRCPDGLLVYWFILAAAGDVKEGKEDNYVCPSISLISVTTKEGTDGNEDCLSISLISVWEVIIRTPNPSWSSSFPPFCHVFLHQLQTSITQSFIELEYFLILFLRTRSHDGSAHTFRSSLRFLEVPQKGVLKNDFLAFLKHIFDMFGLVGPYMPYILYI